MPAPPRTVAEVARIATNRSTDLIAVLKQVCRERSSKTGHDVADALLLDDSEIKPDHLAIVTVSVFGSDKIKLLRDNVGKTDCVFQPIGVLFWRSDYYQSLRTGTCGPSS